MLSSILTLVLSYFVLWLQHLKQTRSTASLPRRLSPDPRDPLGFWIQNLKLFVLSLSDQQLVTGLLLLICAYDKYYAFSARGGGNNLWNAADIVCFSSMTHAATLLTLRSCSGRHRMLTFFRVWAMYVIYILWMVTIIHILKPSLSAHERPIGKLIIWAIASGSTCHPSTAGFGRNYHRSVWRCSLYQSADVSKTLERLP